MQTVCSRDCGYVAEFVAEMERVVTEGLIGKLHRAAAGYFATIMFQKSSSMIPFHISITPPTIT